jgi:phage N-6-adenine-methyltransferase
MNKDTFQTMYSSKGQEWFTPLDLYHKLDEEFHFYIDPCTTSANPLGCRIFYTKEDDGLTKDWPRGNVFCNPPYGRVGKGPKWVEKCVEHAIKRGKGTVVLLIPARTDTRWWFDHIWDGEKHKPRNGVEIRFIKGRLKFGNPEHRVNTAPFPSAVVVFRPTLLEV